MGWSAARRRERQGWIGKLKRDGVCNPVANVWRRAMSLEKPKHYERGKCPVQHSSNATDRDRVCNPVANVWRKAALLGKTKRYGRGNKPRR